MTTTATNNQYGNMHEIKVFFYKPGTTDLHKEKIASIIILSTLLIGLLVYGKYRNKNLTAERIINAKYVIGFTIKSYKNFRSPNPTVKYWFLYDNRRYKSFEEIPDTLHGKIVDTDGRYYVEFSYKNPKNCKLLLMYPVPDSVQAAPDDGWDYMPGYKR